MATLDSSLNNANLAMLPPSAGSIGISLRIMDSNGRLLVNLNQQLSLTDQLEALDSNTKLSESTISAATLASRGSKTNKLKNKIQHRVRFNDSDSNTASMPSTVSAVTIDATNYHNVSASSAISADLIGRINTSLGRIASFAKENQKSLTAAAASGAATSTGNTSSDYCSPFNSHTTSTLAVPICIRKTAWNANELCYAIDSDTTAEDDQNDTRLDDNESSYAVGISTNAAGLLLNSNRAPAPAPASKGGDYSELMRYTSFNQLGTAMSDATLASSLSCRYQRDIITHTIETVLDQLCRLK